MGTISSPFPSQILEHLSSEHRGFVFCFLSHKSLLNFSLPRNQKAAVISSERGVPPSHPYPMTLHCLQDTIPAPKHGLPSVHTPQPQAFFF